MDDELVDIPEWGRQFVEDVRQQVTRLSGQTYDIDIIQCTIQKTFQLAIGQLEGLSVEQQKNKITKEWIAQLATEAFIQLLLNRLSLDPASHFGLLYAAFQQKIRHYIVSYLKKAEDDPDVDDCVQGTFIKIFHSLMNKRKRGQTLVYPFTGWLYSVARSVCLEFWEKRKKMGNISLNDPANPLEQVDEDKQRQPDLYLETKERNERVRMCIEGIPEPCRSCILLFYYSAFSLAEIATRLDISLSRVKTCIYQLAARHFRKLWLEEGI
ncbi:hypothetical protein KSF_090360 [Reticulibacter mediterranei]|uniref:Uncharacterized protein n=1 Tax=Reticulibacter mediterranei TaxID=2778369 RepID=A0A8J3IRJ8_9CHLR|nr:RNA polymerase sigma factor [Reticulibacter mediterranei]GHO98988.1 hypothetical protein KSF_090360 [Reticulibacter mediterranei]